MDDFKEFAAILVKIILIMTAMGVGLGLCFGSMIGIIVLFAHLFGMTTPF